MKRTMNQLAVVGCSAVLALSMAACNSNNGNNNQAGKQSQVGPEWQLKIKTACADGSTDTCQGYYGLAVDSDGKLTVGVDHADKKIYPLSADEKAAVQTAAAPFVAAIKGNATDNRSCDPRDSGSLGALAFTDTVTLTYQSNAREVTTSQDDQFCYHFGNADQAKALHDEMVALLNAHYPAQFPDACQDAIDNYNLNVLPTYETCNVASDCSYFSGYENNPLRAVPAGVNEYIYTADDTVLAIPAVANAAKVGDGSALQGAIGTVYAACKSDTEGRFWNNKPAGFNTGKTAPVCVQNRCQRDPSIQ